MDSLYEDFIEVSTQLATNAADVFSSEMICTHEWATYHGVLRVADHGVHVHVEENLGANRISRDIAYVSWLGSGAYVYVDVYRHLLHRHHNKLPTDNETENS